MSMRASTWRRVAITQRDFSRDSLFELSAIGVKPDIANTTSLLLIFSNASFQHAAMPDSRPYDALDTDRSGEQEQESLLAAENPQNGSVRPKPNARRQSSISQPPPDGAPRTPRTSNRVRFDIEDEREGQNGHALSPGGEGEEEEDGADEEDYLEARRSSTGQRAPLLTDVQAPSVTAALEFNAEDHLENARPKSGMSSAFMNMANSIIGAGIIGTSLLSR